MKERVKQVSKKNFFFNGITIYFTIYPNLAHCETQPLEMMYRQQKISPTPVPMPRLSFDCV